MVVKKIPNVILTIVGDGPQMKDFKKIIKKLNLEHNIKLIGGMEHKKLMKSPLFQENKVFITTSLTETQGLTLMEAQARGLVAVGVDANGTKDLIKNEYNGFLVKNNNKKEFANKVIRLLLNKKIYNSMRKNTLKEIKKQNISNIIYKWENVYRSAIDGENESK